MNPLFRSNIDSTAPYVQGRVLEPAKSICRGFQQRAWTFQVALVITLLASKLSWASGQTEDQQAEPDRPPSRAEVIKPESLATLHAKVPRVRKHQTTPRKLGDVLVFEGAQDGNRQVDPQVAVGKRHVMHGTNNGFLIFDKQGAFVDGVHQNGFRGGIDPKMFYNPHQGVFGFNLWVYWDKAKKKPVHISISETGDPTQGWHIYSVNAPNGRDGGAIGFSRKWVGYSFPGGTEQSFVLSMDDCIRGKKTKAYHFAGNLGHPVQTQDPRDGLLFFTLTAKEFVIQEVVEGRNGKPVVRKLAQRPHSLKYVGRPPQSPQKNSENRTASGDRRPKAIVLQNDCLWFSHTVNCQGRAAVQWHQVRLDGSIVQTGLIRDKKNSFIQTTLAVNQQEDVLVGFQETGPDMFISPRLAIRKGSDGLGTLRPTVSLGEGLQATKGGAWGDYSGAALDGGNQLDLWTVQSVADKTGRGDTVIAKVPMQATPETSKQK